MKIQITSLDEDGIKTQLELEPEFETEEGLQDFFLKLLKFCVKNGAEFPEEILEYLYDD